MINDKNITTITNANLLKNAANAPSGSPVNLTHLAVGDTNKRFLQSAERQLLCKMNDITRTCVFVIENNPNQLIVEAVINKTVGPFYIREVGILTRWNLFAMEKISRNSAKWIYQRDQASAFILG